MPLGGALAKIADSVASNRQDPKDIDAQQAAESRRLLGQMNLLIERGRLLLDERAMAATRQMVRPLPGTLGAVLYGNPSQPLILEKDWVSLLRSVAARDQLALHALHERVQGPVHALAERIAGSQQIAEQITLEVLCEVWREADRYEARNGTVLAWIMNLTRAAALAERGAQRARVASNSGLSPQERLARRLALETASKAMLPPRALWTEPAWEEVAPGISVKILATEPQKHLVSMFVRLKPRTDYPPHTHASVEELHLLDGELWIDDRQLRPGDFNRAEPGTSDHRVWSETGCTCVLTTGTRDILR